MAVISARNFVCAILAFYVVLICAADGAGSDQPTGTKRRERFLDKIFEQFPALKALKKPEAGPSGSDVGKKIGARTPKIVENPGLALDDASQNVTASNSSFAGANAGDGSNHSAGQAFKNSAVASPKTTDRPASILDQFGFSVLSRGGDLVNKAKDGGSKLRQIFPFNPYIAYGPFLSIPLWGLVGLYIKLLIKTKEFYSSAYRIDFWKKKPYGLKGYYLHPAYYPVDRIPSTTTTTASPPKEEHHTEAAHSYGNYGYGPHEEYGEENTYDLPSDWALYADEDTSLPPLTDEDDHLQNVDKGWRRRMGVAAAVDGKEKSKARRRRKQFAERAGGQNPAQVVDGVGSEGPGSESIRGRPQNAKSEERKESSHRSPSGSSDHVPVTTWRPSASDDRH